MMATLRVMGCLWDIGISYPMRGKGKQKWLVGLEAVFKVCDLLESYELASLLAELFLLADFQPTRHCCSEFRRIGYICK